MDISRRDFLELLGIAIGGILVSGYLRPGLADENEAQDSATLPRRPLGKTGEKLSILGLGGIVVMGAQPADAAETVRESFEKGINYFDVSPTYGDAELKLGPALKPYRKKVFLACKTTRRDREGAEEDLRNSLKRLQTDYLDLYQLHALANVERDVKPALGKGGAIEVFLEAHKQGIVRHIGFSAHSPEAALVAMHEFDFETIMYPINFVTHYRKNLVTEVLTEADKRSMGVIAIKAMAKQRWPEGADRKAYPKCWYEPVNDRELARLALSWSLSQKGVTAALPPGDERLYRLALDLVGQCKELTEEEVSRLKETAAKLEPIF